MVRHIEHKHCNDVAERQGQNQNHELPPKDHDKKVQKINTDMNTVICSCFPSGKTGHQYVCTRILKV